MIVSFSFSNYLSYKNETKLSFEATKSTRLNGHVISVDRHRLLKGLVCFGANASGKTNIIRALDNSRKMVLKGLNNSRYFRPFKIKNEDKVSFFKYEFLIDGDIYCYEFSVDFPRRIILSEKLYSYRKCGIIFERNVSDEHVVISTNIKSLTKDDMKFFDVYSSDFFDNNDNNLDGIFFLSYVAERRKEVSPYYNIYKRVYLLLKKIIIIYPETGYGDFRGIIRDDKDFIKFKELLKDYNIDISDIVEEKVSFEAILPKLASDGNYEKTIKRINDALKHRDSYQIISYSGEICNIRKNENNEFEVVKLSMEHGSNDNFRYEEESAGTQRLFDLLPLLLIDDEEGTLILIDEIENSLHTLLTQKLLFDLFNCKTNLKSQFVITSHDVGLFTPKLLRNDEIILVNKDYQTHQSSITNFSYFKTRSDKDIRDDYLKNVFGAVPKISNR